MSVAGADVVGSIVANHLCCGCGSCVAVCPTGALSMTETPAGFLVAGFADEDACTSCGLCLRACPGAIVTDEQEEAFAGFEDPFIGSIRAAYWGAARETEMRRNGASGGVVTALARHLLDSGSVQAALVTRWSPDDPLRHEAFIARDSEELRQSQKSRYCPVALNTALGQLAEFDTVAAVGLPCHLQGIRHAAGVLSADLPEMIRISLFCDRTLSKLLVDRLLSTAGIAGLPRRFEYRHKGQRGWPGDVFVQDGDGDTVFLSRDERMRRKDPYTPVHCRLCFDKFGVLADVACGDGYGAPPSDDGVSAVLVRTERGEEAVASAGEALQLERVPVSSVLRAHHTAQRRQDCVAYAAAFAELFPKAPRVLPRACMDDEDAANERPAKRCSITIARAVEFEDAADEDEARRIAAAEERRQSIRLLPRRVRGVIVRGIKWCLVRCPGGPKILERLRSVLRSEDSS